VDASIFQEPSDPLAVLDAAMKAARLIGSSSLGFLPLLQWLSTHVRFLVAPLPISGHTEEERASLWLDPGRP
jgi:hypothetical protein